MVRGTLSERAITEYLKVAARIAAEHTDEELGIRYEDYAADLARAKQRMPQESTQA